LDVRGRDAVATVGAVDAIDAVDADELSTCCVYSPTVLLLIFFILLEEDPLGVDVLVVAATSVDVVFVVVLFRLPLEVDELLDLFSFSDTEEDEPLLVESVTLLLSSEEPPWSSSSSPGSASGCGCLSSLTEVLRSSPSNRFDRLNLCSKETNGWFINIR